MDPVCLLVAGVVRATLPAAEFSLAWSHSVQKTRWEERYRVDGDNLLLTEARVQGSGAGMDPPAGATFDRGVWTWKPNTVHAELRLTHSTFTSDYIICAAGRCSNLGALTGADVEGAPVIVRACDRGSGPASTGSEQIRR